MFNLEEFYNSLSHRKIAGAYVCGKWPASIRLHQRIIREIGNVGLDEKINRLMDEQYQNELYELIKSWWTRGRRNLVKKDAFKRVLHQSENYREALQTLNNTTIQEYYGNPNQVEALKLLWEWIGKIHKNRTSAKLVAVSKLLHHILPNVIVPIDRRYTEKFLNNCFQFKICLGRKLQFDNVDDFNASLIFFQDLASHETNKLANHASGLYADTSNTKTIDNWVIMWVDMNLN